jgi:predicted nucleic acid-binding protein
VGLLNDLGDGPVGLDTAAFLYLVEEHPIYLPLVIPVFVAIDQGKIRGVTSALTILETTVVPLRAGDEALARRYEALLTNSRGLTLVPLDLDLLRTAAHLRAVTRLKTPDAIQLAAALAEGCTTFLTNDHRCPQLPGVRILQLDDYRTGDLEAAGGRAKGGNQQ